MKKVGIFFDFGSCQSPEVIKNSKNRQIFALTWFSGLKIFTSHVVYSRIWLNLPMYDHPFFYIFLSMDEANLANKKIVERNLAGRELSDFFTGEMS
jgi:hypothetical protein